jgi:hypothetical protein
MAEDTKLEQPTTKADETKQQQLAMKTISKLLFFGTRNMKISNKLTKS